MFPEVISGLRSEISVR